MHSQRKKSSKGLALTISAILEGLFLIGGIAFIYWLILNIFLQVRISIGQAQTERYGLNLANVLISSEYLAYVEDGKISRGLIDSRKIDSFASKKGGTLDVNSSEYMHGLRDNWKQLDIGYANTVSLVNIIDLESCDTEKNCTIWSTSLIGPTDYLENAKQFLGCLVESFDNDISGWTRRTAGCAGGAIIGGIVGGPIGAAVGCGIGFLVTLWNPRDIGNCFQQSMPEYLKNLFYTGSPISYEGLPVIIRYPNGALHAGRINVGVFSWA
jgi:hypothetical protein